MKKYIINLFITIIIGYIIFRLYTKHNNELFDNNDNSIPKIVWSYWDDIDTIPDSVSKILNERKEVLVGWNSILLNKNTIYEYINPSEFPKNYEHLMPAHKSDWIRLYLLTNHGGLWLDASIIVNSLDTLNQMYDDAIKSNSDIVCFYLHSRMIDNDPYTYIENFFILAPKNNRLVKIWYDEFTSAITMELINYKHELIKLGVKVAQVYFWGEGDTYLTMHAALQKIIQLNLISNPRISLYKAEDSVFKLQDICKWNNTCIRDKLKNDKNTLDIPLIKLTGANREPFGNIEHLNISNNIIPKTIYLSYKTKDIPSYIIQNLRKLNPGYKIKLYDNDDCKKFLIENYTQEYVDLFNFLKDGPIKADFWRLCILYKFGGVYSDIDVEYLVPLDEIIEPDVTFLTCGSFVLAGINPHLIMTIKNHPLLLDCINTYLKMYRNKVEYDYWIYSIVFNVMIPNIKKYIDYDSQKEGILLDKFNNKYQILSEINPGNEDDVYCSYKSIKVLNNRYKKYDRINHSFEEFN